ncbi:MAG: efflux RND transporter periplasmic adaptor subunit [Proteobacteria bacterium]|nr:efflux RND transporter periplasmic adaptor subunit [Pseudomonadota bacterium]
MKAYNMPKKIFTIYIFVLFILTFASCSKPDSPAQEKTGSAPVVSVDVYKIPEPKDFPVELEYPARTKSVSSVTLVARVSGILQSKLFTEGQSVKAEDLLFKIEPDIYEAEAATAQALLEQAIAQLNKTERDWKRMNALYEAQVASEQDRDTALSAYEIAKASVSAARARLLQTGINLNYTDVNATVSGVTGLRNVDVGNFVSAGTPLVTVTQTDPLYVDFSLPDIDFLKTKYELKSGNWAKMGKMLSAWLISDNGRYDEKGTVNFVDTNIDEKTASVKARAVFPNRKSEILPGQFVRIKIEGLKRKNTIVVPQQSVIQNPGGTIVFIVKDGKIAVRPVEVGDTSGENFIIEKGLNEGDLVVVNNFFKIRPDMPVKTDKIINKEA